MADYKVQRALISVSDKTGVVEFAKGLQNLGVEIISTGGTAKLLKENQINVIGISDYTGFPEIMDGRVKTLHPRVHGGLLGIRNSEKHVEQMKKLGIKPIDMVVINLYPFQQTVAKDDVTMEEAIENIDIGGPSMIRSAAKNNKFVAVVTDPSMYPQILEYMNKNDGVLNDQIRFDLARRAFMATAEYDAAIAAYLNNPEKDKFPEVLTLFEKKALNLRYGENPHQMAAFYVEPNAKEPSVSTATKLNGKELSFNNILDINAAYEIVKDFKEPAISIIKHTNPCGAAIADNLKDAFSKAYEADPVSAFGSIIGANMVIDQSVAEEIANPGRFVEAIIAPDYDDEALTTLIHKPKWGKNVRILKTGPLSETTDASPDMRKVVGGVLVQDRDLLSVTKDDLKCVTKTKPTESQIDELLFAWKIAKHVKSNAIVLAKDLAVVGVGAGQMSRVDATELAIKKSHGKTEGAVLASDAFFPFPDAIEAAAEAGIIAIIQPGGSVKDSDVIAACDAHNIAMVFTGKRHFKH